MRHHWLVVLFVLALGLSAPVARAEVVNVDPSKDPDRTLEPAELGKLAALQGAVFPSLISDVSPDDATIVTFISRDGNFRLQFTNVWDGSTRTVHEDVGDFPPFSELRWRDNQTVVYISVDDSFDPVLVALHRETGAVTTEKLDLPGFPISLAPNGTRLLIAQIPDQDPDALRSKGPFDLELKVAPHEHFTPARFDAKPQTLRLARSAVTVSALDLNTGEQVYMLSLPEGSGFTSAPVWTPDSAKVAWVRLTIPMIGREGNSFAEKVTQDALGQLAPTDNPFFQDNFVDIFDINKHDFHLAAIKATDGNGDIFRNISWSTDGQTLIAQMNRPARIVGRPHPTYLFPDRSSYRFYNAHGEFISSFDAPALEAPTMASAQFISPDEVVFNAPFGLSYRLYYYNHASKEFRQIALEEGTYYEVRPTHQSRQLIYTFSSFKQPYEVFRIGWDGSALAQVTWYNAEIAAINQVRADYVSFTLRNGATRGGYIVQPAGASFPPHKMRMVVWQQGGPGLTMTNEWGGNVEQPFNLLPNFGLAVLILPLPGREGFGPAFYNSLATDRNFGAIDIDEAAQVVEQMIRRGYTARNSVGITGCSYGGYFTSQSITRYPNLYAAANTQCTLLDLFNEWQVGFTPLMSYLMGRVPTVDSTEYLRDSPAYNASKVRTPLLIFSGVNDFLPSTISTNFYDQIAISHTPVKLLRFDREYHGLQSTNSQLAAGQAQINWFRQYLATP